MRGGLPPPGARSGDSPAPLDVTAAPSGARPGDGARSGDGARPGDGVRLPDGVRDYLPGAAAARRAIADALLAEFERWGYRRIVTPAFEYEAVLARGLGGRARTGTLRFVEPTTGDVLALRPDITPQVARLVATRLAGEPGPIRLAYEGGVVRLAPGGGQRELYQAGIELCDAPSPAGDVEVIELGAAALEAAGLARYTLDLGEPSVVRAALAGVGDGRGAALERAIARKDAATVAREAAALGLGRAQRRLVEALPTLHGGVEVIERAASLLGEAGPGAEAAEARAGLATLAAIAARLGATLSGAGERLTVDLGEVRGFDYYTGVRVQGFAAGVGEALLSGGRYDRLVERYGRPARAAGFAVDVERLGAALDAAGRAPAAARAGGVYLAGELSGGARLARSLRRAGLRVVQHLDGAAVGDAALLAIASREGVAHLAVVLPGGGARVHDLAATAAVAPVEARSRSPGRRSLSPAALAAIVDGGALDALLG